jgi:hypothetical protein
MIDSNRAAALAPIGTRPLRPWCMAVRGIGHPPMVSPSSSEVGVASSITITLPAGGLPAQELRLVDRKTQADFEKIVAFR